MCRLLGYLGEPVPLEDLFYKPDSSFIAQAYSPRMLHMLNLAGFGMTAWDRASHDAEEPFAYRSAALPFFDANLKALSQKVRASALIAHVRGVPYDSRAQVGE